MRLVLATLVLITFTGPAAAADTADLEKKVADAKAAVETAKVAVIAKLEATPQYKTAVADAAEKFKALEDARANGTPSDRIAASSAYGRARAAIEKLKSEAMKTDPDVMVAVSAQSDAEHHLSDMRRADAIASEDKKRAMRVHGGLSQQNDQVVKSLGGQVPVEAAELKKLRELLELQDWRIADYLKNHEVPERVKSAAMAGEPAPGTPEELLKLLGDFTVQSETEQSKVGYFEVYGCTRRSWNMTVASGKVIQQAPAGGRSDLSIITPK